MAVEANHTYSNHDVAYCTVSIYNKRYNVTLHFFAYVLLSLIWKLLLMMDIILLQYGKQSIQQQQ
jgi:hypothetical protein